MVVGHWGPEAKCTWTPSCGNALSLLRAPQEELEEMIGKGGRWKKEGWCLVGCSFCVDLSISLVPKPNSTGAFPICGSPQGHFEGWRQYWGTTSFSLAPAARTSLPHPKPPTSLPPVVWKGGHLELHQTPFVQVDEYHRPLAPDSQFCSHLGGLIKCQLRLTYTGWVFSASLWGETIIPSALRKQRLWEAK